MEIKTNRLILCPLGIRYLESTHEYASDREATKYMMFLPNDTMEETEDFLKNADAEWNKQSPEFYEFAVLLNHRHIGAVSLYLDERRTTGEFGWILHRDFWRQGITTEAVEALLDYSVNVLGIRHFIAHCDSENIASYKVMEKLGMVKTGCNGGRKNKSSDEERNEYLYELQIDSLESKRG